MRFAVDDKVFELFPDYMVAVVIAENFDNIQRNEEVSRLLVEQCQRWEGAFTTQSLKEYPPVAVWRKAFKKLRINPNKYPSSIEAMMKRVSKGKQLPAISPIVDLCNSISLKYCVPMGTHDVDSWIDGCLSVRISTCDDRFLPFGGTEYESVDADEIVYVSGHDVRTRRWVWRQSETARITPVAARVFIPIDGFSATKQAVLDAQRELIALLDSIFGIRAVTGLVTRHQSVYEWHSPVLSNEVLGCPVEEGN